MSEPLTEEAVAALPEGTEVEIIWSGGNGPHRYIVHEKAGTLYAGDPRNDNAISGVGSFVGQERYHTRVWLVDEGSATPDQGKGEPR